MGKTENGAIWLDKNFLPPYEYWQFWRNTDDRDVIKFLKFFTDIEVNKIDELEKKDINSLKILLANETTSMLHGQREAKNCEDMAKSAFSGNLSKSNLPTIKIDKKNFQKGLNIIDLIIVSNLEKSRSEIRRLIKGNAIKINNKIIETEKFIVEKRLFDENFIKLSIGKKRHLKIEIN